MLWTTEMLVTLPLNTAQGYLHISSGIRQLGTTFNFICFLLLPVNTAR